MELSLADPAGADVLTAAMLWLQQTLMGTIALTVATLAVAFTGFLMLSGRIAFRRGLTVVTGCFVLFGAPGIAAGILGAARQGVTGAAQVPAAAGEPAGSAIVIPPDPPGQPKGYDPYAGASVPSG
ncbi:TrbC/VirB2 family protein [Sphingomonas canadensis]|uniref:TrbC/VirB2 family protein n=1 Tax=Sphingomonas canadensis TaxID=1219257 RepID=A0ABW3HBX0_9SPHN|nr:TrbC/VirB2 family protein [Sphingomonas canadensis]MCW3836410.1 TrbC/VirB2 family protein [Sphingomonas canadensis]